MVELTARRLKLPYAIASKYARQGTNLYEELVSAGFYGLVCAARTYDEIKAGGSAPDSHLYSGTHWAIWNHIRPRPKDRHEVFWRERVGAWDSVADATDGLTMAEAFSGKDPAVGVECEAADEADFYLKRLSTRDREMFVLRYRDGLSLREVAERVGVSKVWARHQLNRIREELRTIIYFEGAA